MQTRNLKTHYILCHCEQRNTKSISSKYQIKYSCFKKYLELLYLEIISKFIISCGTHRTFVSSDIQKLSHLNFDFKCWEWCTSEFLHLFLQWCRQRGTCTPKVYLTQQDNTTDKGLNTNFCTLPPQCGFLQSIQTPSILNWHLLLAKVKKIAFL